MTTPRRDNVLIVHWHDLGRYLGVYGHEDVRSPRLDQLAAEGILFTRAHATAPLCSPSRGSLFTGRYPQSNGLVGLAHHGWEYRADVRTLPHLLGEAGWRTTLYGMQHETSYPARLGFDEYDVSNSYCEYVVAEATRWLADAPREPFLLTTGFFETHRPYPRERYEPADADRGRPPTICPTPTRSARISPILRIHHRGRRGRRTTARRARRQRVGPHHVGDLHDRPRSCTAAREVDLVRRGHRYRDDHPPAPRRRHPALGLRRSVQRCRPGTDAAGIARRGNSRRPRQGMSHARIC